MDRAIKKYLFDISSAIDSIEEYVGTTRHSVLNQVQDLIRRL